MNYASQRRVVITGIGLIAPNGHDVHTFWNSIRLGISAAGPLTRFPAGAMRTAIACEVRGFDAKAYLGLKRSKHLDLSTQYGIAAAQLAVRDAELAIKDMDPRRVGVMEAISLGGTETTLAGQDALNARNFRAINAYSLINGYTGSGAGEIALDLGVRGGATTHCAGSASGNDAMGAALRLIRNDEVDVMVVGGAEAPLLPALWAVFCNNRVMSSRNAEPTGAMRPFDKTRDGFVCGEGGAFLILEELGHALSRGARIYAELAGHGRSCEAYHSAAPHPAGLGVVESIENALRDAGVSVADVQYINMHGTATGPNDIAESVAVKRVFSSRDSQISVSSTKPVTGHLLGCAGALETAVCALAIHHHEIPFTLNHREPEEGCDLDYVPERSRPYPIDLALNLNSGFGGKNSCVVVRRLHRHA